LVAFLRRADELNTAAAKLKPVPRLVAPHPDLFNGRALIFALGSDRLDERGRRPRRKFRP
jgi:hypothetical protein